MATGSLTRASPAGTLLGPTLTKGLNEARASLHPEVNVCLGRAAGVKMPALQGRIFPVPSLGPIMVSSLARVEWNGVPFCPAWNGTAFRFAPRGMERRSVLSRAEWNGVPF
jgi:hypothetical protein